MSDPTVADRLRRNTKELVMTVDMYPTIKGAFWGSYDYLAQAKQGCITGVDLTAVDVPQDRVALSINYRSSQLAGKNSPFKGEFWAVSTKELALYHRKAKNRHPKLNQGKNNYYVLEFGECESSTSKTTLCLHTPKEDDLDYFRGVIGWIKNTQLLGEGVKSSELVNMFAEKVMYNEVAIAADSPTEVSSSSKGFIASMLHSVQDKAGIDCDDVLLFMPEIHASPENQLNSYVRAALIATFANKAFLVLDAPQESFCPADAKDHPLGLSSVVDVPVMLTRRCPLPCQGTRSYDDWQNVRTSAQPNELFEPVMHLCKNDNGRESRVLPLGVDELQMYFEKYYAERMLQRPLPEATDWALRLGATQEEAEKLSDLVTEELWDYLGALLVRADVLKLQPLIEHAVDVYMGQHPLAGGAANYDSVQIHRGNNEDPAVEGFVAKYWETAGLTPQSYVPLAHYLRNYTEVKCTKERLNSRQKKWGRLPRIVKKAPVDVHIVTDDPAGITREIDQLGAKTKAGRTQVSECLAIGFTISAPQKEERTGSCANKYENLIAGLAQLKALQNSRRFIAELHSGWSRLAWISRLMLTAEGKKGKDLPILLKDTWVAWGYTHPGPPGW